jgi:hypothetical protein
MLFSTGFSRKLVLLLDALMWKYGRASQVTGDNIILRRKGAIRMPDIYGKNTDTLIIFNTYFFVTD